MTGRLIGVGVGPGDPALITVKARDTLRAAEVVFVPVVADAAVAAGEGYAERVVRCHVPHATRLQRLQFSLRPGARSAAWQAAGAEVAAVLRTGRTAAFATIGDPNLYSTFTHLAREVRRLVPDAAIDTVPGITALQDLAARSGTVLAERDETLALLPLTAGGPTLRAALATFDTVVGYKGGRHLPDVVAALRDTGRTQQAVYGARLGLAGEDIRRGGDLPSDAAPYLATVIVVRERGGSR